MAIFGGTYMDDLLIGGPDPDVLWGGMGEDTLQGGAGNDTLSGGPGGDKLEGGPGNEDIASYTQSPSGVQVDLSTSFTDTVDDKPATGEGDAEGDVLTGIENIWGSGFGDILLGNHSSNSLFGNAGDDIIHGGGGNDLLRGGADNDRLGGRAVDQSDGTKTGDDEAGNDTMYGGEGNDQLQGGTGNDMLFGGMGDDGLEGGYDDDFLEGGLGADALDGGMGTDTAAYTMSSEAVTVDLRFGVGPGSSTIKAPMGGDAMGDTFVGIENLRGSMYDDILIGDDMGMPLDENDPATTVDESMVSTTGNKLFGNMGDDMLKGLAGNDTLQGGKGDDTLYGGDGNDTVMGELGDDAIKGDDGDDTLIGGPGADKLFGGQFIAADMRPGDDNDDMGDTASYSGSSEGVTISLIANDHDNNAATPLNIMGMGGDAEGDVLVAIEHLTGSSHKDMLEGDELPNHLKGGGGDDWNDTAIRGKDGGLYGGADDDTLEGGGGNDWLEGQEGNDTLKGGSGNDMLDGGVQPDADDETTTPVVTGRKASVDNPVTTTVNETAMRSFDTFDQVLEGGAGDDTLKGGEDVQRLDGGTGVDTVDYTGVDRDGDNAVEGGVTIVLDSRGNFGTKSVDMNGDGDTEDDVDVVINDGTVDNTATPPVTNPVPFPQFDVLVGIENLIGSDDADVLVGNSGRNELGGGGGIGNMLTGGDGADTFLFDKDDGETATTTITDFSKVDGDKIDLEDFGLTATDLGMLLEKVVPGVVSQTDGRLTYELNLNSEADGIDVNGGTITVTMDERFAELDTGDFLI